VTRIALLAQESSGGGGGAGGFVLLGVMVVAFYFVGIRPQRNRLRAAQALQSSLEPGQRVMTTAGIHATVVEIRDDTVQLEIAPGVVVTCARAAVGRLIDDPADVPAEPVDEPAVGE
jgi:preprotein translocase subunit YajC